MPEAEKNQLNDKVYFTNTALYMLLILYYLPVLLTANRYMLKSPFSVYLYYVLYIQKDWHASLEHLWICLSIFCAHQTLEIHHNLNKNQILDFR